MIELEEYFKQDCGEMDKNRPPFDFYVMGYNRAQIVNLEIQIEQLQRQLQREEIKYKYERMD